MRFGGMLHRDCEDDFMKLSRKRMLIGVAAVLLSIAAYVAVLGGGSGFGVTLGEPVINGHRYDVSLVNESARRIQCRLIGNQMKVNESWVDHVPMENRAGELGTSVRGLVPVFSPMLVSAQGELVFHGPVPKHITRPQGATAWRAVIEWSYAEPSKLERWLSGGLRLVAGRTGAWVQRSHTNFTSEVKF